MDESGFVTAFYEPEDLLESINSPTFTSVAGTVNAQPDFNSGGSDDVLKVLQGVAATTGSVATTLGTIAQLPAQISLNRAAAQQADAITRTQLATSGQLAQIQSATLLAQAKAAYNKAAGVVDGSSMVVILTIVGVGISVLMFLERKK